jgi:hypothetical protein
VDVSNARAKETYAGYVTSGKEKKRRSSMLRLINVWDFWYICNVMSFPE